MHCNRNSYKKRVFSWEDIRTSEYTWLHPRITIIIFIHPHTAFPKSLSLETSPSPPVAISQIAYYVMVQLLLLWLLPLMMMIFRAESRELWRWCLHLSLTQKEEKWNWKMICTLLPISSHSASRMAIFEIHRENFLCRNSQSSQPQIRIEFLGSLPIYTLKSAHFTQRPTKLVNVTKYFG